MKPDSPISFSHADMASLDAILTQAVRLGASDVLLIADVSVTLRVGGRLAHSTGAPLTGALGNLAEARQGLVLVTGPTGCGKSSTLAALVDLINHTRHVHVVTIED